MDFFFFLNLLKLLYNIKMPNYFIFAGDPLKPKKKGRFWDCHIFEDIVIFPLIQVVAWKFILGPK